jgi:hypothetical protein
MITITAVSNKFGKPGSRKLDFLDYSSILRQESSQKTLCSNGSGIAGSKRGRLLRGFAGGISFPAGTKEDHSERPIVVARFEVQAKSS